jgi:putative transposase
MCSSKIGAPTPVGKVRPVLTVVPGTDDAEDPRRPEGAASLIDTIVRDGARRMLAAALQAEVDAYIAAFTDQRDEAGRRLVVRNGSHQTREVLTSAGAVEVTAPRVNDRRVDPDTGERLRFASAILPAWCRKTPKIAEVLPLLYLHGLSSSDFGPALGQFLGSSHGLSASVITKLTESWKAEQRAFGARDLSGVDYVYLWADGIHVNIRLEEHKLCLLMLIGVRADGRKELVALADGYRESTESWADLLRDCSRRGMRAPVLAVGDGALGFWGALREVFPATREQRCWFHRSRQELIRCFGSWWSLDCYGDRRGGDLPARGPVRGVVAAPERAAAAAGGGHRGPAARSRWGAGRGPGRRDERDHGASRGRRARGRRGAAARRSGPRYGRRA